VIKSHWDDPDFVLPDRDAVTMRVPFMQDSCDLSGDPVEVAGGPRRSSRPSWAHSCWINSPTDVGAIRSRSSAPPSSATCAISG
jgi:hypothetical protein